MRLTLISPALLLLTADALAPTAFADTPVEARPPSPEDLLGNMVVVAGAGRPLPRIGIQPSLASDIEDVTLRSVVQSDLDLCGEFEVLPDSSAPEGLYLSDTPVDVKAWSAKGALAVVKVTGKKSGKDQAELRAQAFLVRQGATPVFDKVFSVPVNHVREESHRLADLVIGALTGQNGDVDQ